MLQQPRQGGNAKSINFMLLQNNKRIIYIQEHTGKATANVLRIRDMCDAKPNIGSICLGSDRHPNTDIHHLDLSRDLINDIASAGGNFLLLPTVPTDGALRVGSGRHTHGLPAAIHHRGESACWGGCIYVSWRGYRHLREAIAYLKRFFDVRACSNNKTYDQSFINRC